MQIDTGTGTITLQLNGAQVTTAPGTTLGGFLDGKGIVRQMIAVEYNGEILPRRNWDQITLQDGDRLEVVQMVGGG